LAQGGVLAAHRRNNDVPITLAIAGFNDLNSADQMLPSLTTIRTPRAAIGRTAAMMMLDLLRNKTVASPAVDLGYELIVRESR
jgi:LacI family transcriptional regulator, gluconate utilization system Gnt-I transcriptional repressor